MHFLIPPPSINPPLSCLGSVEDRLSARKSSVRIVTGFGRLRKKTESMDSLSGGMPMTARGSIDTNPSARDSASAIAALDASPGKKKGAGADRLSLNSQMQTSGSKAGTDGIPLGTNCNS